MSIQVSHVSYDYPGKKALRDVSFEIEDGAITALVGPNGSGKTTLLRCLAALTKPLKGEIFINGINALTSPLQVHRQIGYLSDFFGLYDDLTVQQSMSFIAHSMITGTDQINSMTDIAIRRAGADTFKDKRISSLSRGMRQRVGIAQAIVHQPKVLLLDEPASGLDPEARYSLSKLLLQLRDDGMTIIVSSHILAELKDYSSEMLVLEEGKMIDHHKLDGAKVVSRKNILVKLSSVEPALMEAFKQWQGVEEVNQQNSSVAFKLDEQVISKHDMLKKLLENQFTVEEFTEVKLDLQDQYIKTVSEYKKSKA